MENKAQRLSVAAVIAPSLRSASSKTRTRPVAVVDRKGKIVRYTTVADVQESVLAAKKIEIEMAEGVRPKEFVCNFCGSVEPLSKKARRNLSKVSCKKCAYRIAKDNCSVEVITRRTRAALAEKKGRGERVGQVPYGFQVSADGVRLEQNAQEQIVIQQVRELRREGLSHRSIVRALQDLKVVSRVGRAFGQTQVARMLDS